jgi:tRNA (guanine-N7-)-methyltransferase
LISPQPIIYPLGTIVERLELSRLFTAAQPLEVELGSGDGSFLAQYAALHPERNFIGVERLLGRLRKLERKCQRAGIFHVRAIRIEASYFLDWLLPPNSTAALHIYFPDPWPKRKHRKHRLINDRFPLLARAVLRPDGAVFLRTDDADYFAQMQAVFAASPFFKPIETPPDLAAMLTDFERDFQRQGIATLRAAFQSVG